MHFDLLAWAAAASTALGVFIAKAVWPFAKRQYELVRTERQELRAERQESLNQFMKALERRDAEFSKIVKGLELLGHKIDAKGVRRER